MKKYSSYILLALLISLVSTCSSMNNLQNLLIHTIYGDFEVTEPVLIDLFNNPIMERIKHVKQYGVLDYVIKQKKEYTRYEHCVGVWALLRLYNATLEEQIAGLLHDVSHTVFSHVADMLFNHQSHKDSYQDSIHEWYLKEYAIDTLLAQHNIPLAAILHKSGTHTMLEQDLPNICADRLEYNLQAGILTNMLTTTDIKNILKNVRYARGQWFFIDQEYAKKLALVSLFNTEHVWGGIENQFIYSWTVYALRRALHVGIISLDDIHFSTDPLVWEKLWISDDPFIAEYLDKIVHHKEFLLTAQTESIKKGKFRGLDPLIQEGNTLKRLTTVDTEYHKEYNRVKMSMTAQSRL